MFERFTDRSRRVLVYAQEEAARLKHSFMGTEHILLGLIREEAGVAAIALGRCGISLEAARTQVELIVSSPADQADGSPPFTPRAKKILELSLREALQLGHSYIGTEHILLGLIREGQGVGAAVIERLDVDLGLVRQEVIALMSGTAEGVVRKRSKVADPPRCQRCGAGLAEDARYRVIEIPQDGRGVAKDPISVRMVYCQLCGIVIGPAGLAPGSAHNDD